MSKIICDICGTSYPETAKQCPICGCVRPGDVQRVTNEVKSNGNVSTGYTYVKGGRFSKTNVKKRTHAQTHTTAASKSSSRNRNSNNSEKDNRGLVITAIVLLLAIIGVVIYLALEIFVPYSDPNGDSTQNTSGQQVEKLACESIHLDVDTILFEQLGEGRLLQFTLQPKDTTDVLSFRSENEAVATVDKNGMITAVSEGTTTIVISCGKVTQSCTVTVQKPDSTDPSGTDNPTLPDEPTKPAQTLRLNRTDITFKYKGESWVLYNGDIAKNLITWSSDDESVVTFADGKAVAVGNNPDGVMVHAEYEGQKVSCLIRCSFKEDSGVGGNGGVTEDGGGSGGNGGVTEDGGNGNVITGTINVQDSLNVRSGPGTTYALAGTLKPNEKVTITEQTTAEGMVWGKIGEGRWISMSYVIVD